MTSRYFGKVVSVQDSFTVVINAGEEAGVKIGDEFLIIGIGEIIIDPDTNEELEKLEIVRGKAKVSHVQSKIATLVSTDLECTPDTKEIKKVTTKNNIATPLRDIFNGPQDVITESIKPGDERPKKLKNVTVGDFVIKLIG
jgi:hypothetical protein